MNSENSLTSSEVQSNEDDDDLALQLERELAALSDDDENEDQNEFEQKVIDTSFSNLQTMPGMKENVDEQYRTRYNENKTSEDEAEWTILMAQLSHNSSNRIDGIEKSIIANSSSSFVPNEYGLAVRQRKEEGKLEDNRLIREAMNRIESENSESLSQSYLPHDNQLNSKENILNYSKVDCSTNPAATSSELLNGEKGEKISEEECQYNKASLTIQSGDPNHSRSNNDNSHFPESIAVLFTTLRSLPEEELITHTLTNSLAHIYNLSQENDSDPRTGIEKMLFDLIHLSLYS